MNHLKSLVDTCKPAAERFGAALIGVLALIAGCILLSAFATLGLAVLGLGAVGMTVALGMSALTTDRKHEAAAA